MEYLGTYLIIAAILLAIVFVKKSLVIIPQSETKIIERLGKFRAILKPGVNIIIPFGQSPLLVFKHNRPSRASVRLRQAERYHQR